MRKLVFVTVVLLFSFLWAAKHSAAAEGPPTLAQDGGGMAKRIVARVNGVEITLGALATMMKSLSGSGGHEVGPPKDPGELRKEALEQLVIQELAYQKAMTEGLSADPKEIDEALGGMKKKMGSEEKFREFLAKERITEGELRKRVERNLTVKRIFKKEISDGISVTEEDVRQEYEKEKSSYSRKEKVVVADVVFFLKPGEAGSIGKVEEVRRKIVEQKEMNPAGLVSDGTFAVTEMELLASRDRELYEAAKKMKVGELSGALSASGNLHLILLREHTPFLQYPFEQVKKMVERKLRTRLMKDRLEKWEAELKKGAKVEILEFGSGAAGREAPAGGHR